MLQLAPTRGYSVFLPVTIWCSFIPSIFQLIMEVLLQGLDGVVVYLKDILRTRRSRKEHLQRLEEILKQLQDAGLREKRDKCRFMGKDVMYLGHRIFAQGLQPTKDNMRLFR